jgi:hypothetical protein
VIGARVRIDDLPEQPGESKIPIHRFFAPLGLLLLIVGLYGLHNYFCLNGPPLAELHEFKLAGVTNVVLEPEIPGSIQVGNMWLQTSADTKIRYHKQYPYADAIQRLDPDYGLLLDKSNLVWGITTSRGEVLARNYFEEQHIEAKSVGKICGSFLTFVGLWLLLIFALCELRYRAGTLSASCLIFVRTRQVVLIGSLVVYLFLCAFVMPKVLPQQVAGWAMPFIWVIGAGVLGNGIVAYYRKHRPMQ